MRIEQDLRIVIKAAANASKHQDRSKTDRELIDDWMKRNPVKAKQATLLQSKIKAAEEAKEKAEAELEKRFGLASSKYHGVGGFYIDSESIFQKAGGKTASKMPKFSEDQVISEYAGAKTKAEATAVLKKYGIIWQ